MCNNLTYNNNNKNNNAGLIFDRTAQDNIVGYAIRSSYLYLILQASPRCGEGRLMIVVIFDFAPVSVTPTKSNALGFKCAHSSDLQKNQCSSLICWELFTKPKIC